MTPFEEQQLMQAYVRQQLARQGTLNLTPGQVPLGPGEQDQFLQRPPLAPGVGQPGPPGPSGDPFSGNAAVDMTQGTNLGVRGNIAPPPMGGGPLPVLGMQGGVSPQRLRDLRDVARSQFMYRQSVPF